MDRTDELSLMKKVRAGDTKAFRELVRPYEQRAFSTALAILGSQPLAEEAVQRVFVETYRTLKRKDIHPFRAWLDDRIACSVLDAAGKRLWQETLTDADSAHPGHSDLLRSVMTVPYRHGANVLPAAHDSADRLALERRRERSKEPALPRPVEAASRTVSAPGMIGII
ncbi:RNA polymerase sigma factor [Paenibacillus tyrfis]|uniref:RNA polymerase sigma factor n=1 Tax=Paenibacillus tyrfis TaxID=1501230 RepID=UPI00209FB96C|nr:sigma factor [Paenibacillus tyrfis]MCP1310988.1 hypothetical protein [Paenibacillus tyrfis]